MKTESSVVDIKKLTDAEIGKIYRKTGEIIRRVNDGTISFEDSIRVIQEIIIEGKSTQHLDVIKGLAKITYGEHFINGDVEPFIPKGLTLVEHEKIGKWEWNPNIHFYLSEKQIKGEYSGGRDLRKELVNQSVLNANVLDYLLVHLELIPERWKGKSIFFWGTIYRGSDGGLYVRYLNCIDFKWEGCHYWIDYAFGSNRPAALAS